MPALTATMCRSQPVALTLTPTIDKADIDPAVRYLCNLVQYFSGTYMEITIANRMVSYL